MVRRAIFALAFVPLIAGCLAPALGPPAPIGGILPTITADGATFEALDGAVRVTWQGTTDNTANLPRVDPRWPLPTTLQIVARHDFELGPEATTVNGNLTWSATPGLLILLVTNATGAIWCGARGGELEAGCVGTLNKARETTESWSVRLLMEPSDGQPAPVDYVVSLLFRSDPLIPQGPPVRPGTLRFAPPVAVDPTLLAAEPSLAVTPQGTVYVAALPHGNDLWKSEDGITFERLRATDLPYCQLGTLLVPRLAIPDPIMSEDPEFTHFGCGDVDIATSGEDTVWFSAHWGNEAVSVSQDRGASWITNVLAAGADAHTDRQWLVTDGPQTAWHVQTSWYSATASARGAPSGDFTVTKTLDGGQSWLPLGRVEIGPRRCVSTLARDPAGVLYLGSCDQDGPGVAVSEDGGVLWEWRPGPPREERLGFLIIVVTTDAAGNVYLVWVEPVVAGEGTPVAYAVSTDHGLTWSEPREVFSQPGTFVLPWATGGAPGHLAVAAYGTKDLAAPQDVLGEWYPVVAVTQDALAEAPMWEEAEVGERPNQWGPICLGGNGCVHGRNLADYFQVQADGEGRIHIAYTAANAEDGQRPYAWYARQVAGPTLGGPSVDKNGGR